MTLTVERCSPEAVRPTIEAHHYLKRWPHPLSKPFAQRLIVDGQKRHPDGRPFGIVVWKILQHGKQRGLFGYDGLPTRWQVLDMARVWVHPSLQTAWTGIDRHGNERVMSANVFSRMVSLSLKMVQRDWIDHHPPVFPDQPYHIVLVVSYCDRKHHQGTGYRASGFELLGPSSDGTKDVYVRRLKTPRWSYVPRQARLWTWHKSRTDSYPICDQWETLKQATRAAHVLLDSGVKDDGSVEVA